MSVTRGDVWASFVELERLVRRCGLIPAGDRLVLTTGSPSNGRAWRINLVPAGETGEYSFAGMSYLGWSAREAALTLSGLKAGIRLAAMVGAQ